MWPIRWWAGTVLAAVLASSALGQDPEPRPDGPAEEPEPQGPVQTWRVGMIVTAAGPCSGVVGTMAVPADWPEQKVRILSEDLSRGVKVRYQMVEGAVRQMTVTVPRIEAGAEAKAVVTFEVRIAWEAPGDTSALTAPDLKKLDRALKPFLEPSPLIESDDPQIKAIAERVGRDQKDAWSRVEAVYDWVRQQVRYDKDSPLKGALAALKDGTGDCDELTALFIAVCRAGGVPARTVRVPGHVWAEFYLEDAKGQGRWFPCEVAGARSFGDIRTPKPVLQKGDAMKVRNPQTKRVETVRFLPENLVVSKVQPGAEPKLKLVCEPAGRTNP